MNHWQKYVTNDNRNGISVSYLDFKEHQIELKFIRERICSTLQIHAE
jgi:hypothetical protein